MDILFLTLTQYSEYGCRSTRDFPVRPRGECSNLSFRVGIPQVILGQVYRDMRISRQNTQLRVDAEGWVDRADDHRQPHYIPSPAKKCVSSMAQALLHCPHSSPRTGGLSFSVFSPHCGLVTGSWVSALCLRLASDAAVCVRALEIVARLGCLIPGGSRIYKRVDGEVYSYIHQQAIQDSLTTNSSTPTQQLPKSP